MVKKFFVLLGIGILIVFGVKAFSYFRGNAIDDGRNKGKTIVVANKDGVLTDIGQKVMKVYMDPFINRTGRDGQNVKNFKVKKEEILKFNKDELAVKVDFSLNPENGGVHRTWGETKNGELQGSWILRIKFLGKYNCQIIDKERAGSDIDKSKIIRDLKRKERYITEKDKNYYLEDNNTKITYDGGKTWVNVPIDRNALFERKELISRSELQKGSYIITPENTSFVYGGNDKIPLSILISRDKGVNWSKQIVTKRVTGNKQLFLGFTSSKDGYIVSTGKGLTGSEHTFIYTTNDGGVTWTNCDEFKINKNHIEIIGSAFSTDKIGFLCYKSEDKYPNIQYTVDKAETWQNLKLQVPSEYEGKLTEAMSPIFEGSKGTLVVKQNKDGGLGANKAGKFISEDYGLTWKFDSIITVQ
ncbi:hypothetical protein SAMN02745163_01094 [Clostridium cavendishii DSM 21758]|uniref:Uncharacterized protein n=1 Tax=Clostridium cavendishii DSM 21758 TaxID=1121302 RepID=A0A1M6FC72_9CLOT|nr:hypothetical protein [Clostridium cavendishii]SHI95253.1 hypothetical protein SAMN02745163_01094 [Clostridium cavendishii DSM 21758]